MAYRKNRKPTDMEMEANKSFYEDTGIPNTNSEVDDGGSDMADMESEPVTEDELRNIVSAEITDAEEYIDDVISPQRALAGQYYKGEPFGNEEEGRSQVVSMDVRDTIQAVMPSIMRVFFSANNVVEFAPNGPEDVADAEQATDYINYCLTRDNNLFVEAYSTFKDALIRKNGIMKVWWDKEKNVDTYNFTGLDEAAFLSLIHI